MIKKSYAKVNIFLKILSSRGNYHEIVSRFVRVHSLYDIISFESKSCTSFTIEGNFGCETKDNSINKAYEELKKSSLKVEVFFKNHLVKVEKKIPEFAGLGGGSSNAASFMLMVNEVCDLKLSKDKLCKIATKIGADVPFFIYEYDSANVKGIGEIIEKFEEEALDIEVFTPSIKCNTGEVFNTFRKNFYKELSLNSEKQLLVLKSKQVLDKFDIFRANDLFMPAVNLYPQLKKYIKNDWHFSGSGSSFFRIKNG